jgi:DNA-binding beta-propeller fold protein YncE
VRPLAIVGDRASDRLELYDAAALAPAGCLSVDENPTFIDEPFDLALAPDGQTLYVVLGHADGYLRGTLLKLRLSDGARLGEVSLGEEPAMIALSSDGARAYVSLFRNLAHPSGPWSDPGALVVVDTATMQVVGSVDVCAAGLGVGLDEPRQRAWVACAGDGQLALVDVSGAPRLDRTLPLDDGAGGHAEQPAYLLLDGTRAWVSAQGSGDLWILDQGSAAFVKRIAFGSSAFPQRLAWLPDGTALLIALDGASQLGLVATQGLFIMDRVALDGVHPQGLAVARDGSYLLITDENDLVHPGRVARFERGAAPRISAFAPTAVFPQAVLLIE